MGLDRDSQVRKVRGLKLCSVENRLSFGLYLHECAWAHGIQSGNKTWLVSWPTSNLYAYITFS